MKKDSSQSTQQLLGVTNITDYSLVTRQGSQAVFIVSPTNLSTLSPESIHSKVKALSEALKGLDGLEILCLNSRESFKSSKAFLRRQLDIEGNPAVRKLLEQDRRHLDQIQAQTSTARQFLFVLPLQEREEREQLSSLSRVEQLLRDMKMTVRRGDKKELQQLLAVYYEQNVTTDQFDEVDGGRWLVFGD